MKNEKHTQKEYYLMLKKIVEDTNVINKNELIDFINNRIQVIDGKATRAKKKITDQRDILKTQIQQLLTNDYQSIDMITDQINNDEEVSRAKVTFCLTQLVEEQIAERVEAQTETGKKIIIYRLNSN